MAWNSCHHKVLGWSDMLLLCGNSCGGVNKTCVLGTVNVIPEQSCFSFFTETKESYRYTVIRTTRNCTPFKKQTNTSRDIIISICTGILLACFFLGAEHEMTARPSADISMYSRQHTCNVCSYVCKTICLMWVHNIRLTAEHVSCRLICLTDRQKNTCDEGSAIYQT